MPAVITTLVKRDICLRIDGAEGEEPKRIFLQVKDIGPRKVRLQLSLPDDVKVQHAPDEGEEKLWPDGGINCANEKHGYRIRNQRRTRR